MCVCAITFDFFTSPIKNLLKNLRIIRPILTSIINICKNVYKIKCNDINTFILEYYVNYTKTTISYMHHPTLNYGEIHLGQLLIKQKCQYCLLVYNMPVKKTLDNRAMLMFLYICTGSK